MFYAGIGARKTPRNVQRAMNNVAQYLSNSGYTLRSGAAYGADKAFEQGCDHVIGNKEIFLPWRGHNGSDSEFYQIGLAAYDLVKKHHKNYKALTEGAKKMMGRNTYQILGKNHDELADFVICWTKEGKTIGGTGFSIDLAEHYKIPIFNLGSGNQDDHAQNIVTIVTKKKREEK